MKFSACPLLASSVPQLQNIQHAQIISNPRLGAPFLDRYVSYIRCSRLTSIAEHLGCHSRGLFSQAIRQPTDGCENLLAIDVETRYIGCFKSYLPSNMNKYYEIGQEHQEL